MTDDDRRFVRDPAVFSRQTLPGVVVLGRESDEFRLLEAPGDAIWAALAEPISVEVLVAQLAAAFGAPIATVRTDVTRFLDDLVRAGLAAEAAP